MHEIHLKVPDMSCGHCVGTIQRAVESMDHVIGFEASLETKSVIIKSDKIISQRDMLDAVRGAGYTPELVS